MHDPVALRRRLAEHAVTARYGLFVGVGGALTLIGTGLFVWALMQGHTARAWQLFHVGWLYFTGLAGGAVAIVAVHKVAHAKWSGLILRYAGAAVAFFPVSFLGFLLIFTVGYPHIFPEFHGLGHGKELWLSYPWMFTRLFIGLGTLFLLGWKLVRTDMVPDVYDAKDLVSGGRAVTYAKMTEGYDGSEAAQEKVKTLVHQLAPAYVVVYAIVFSLVAFDMIMALQPHWFSNLLGAFYFMGSFLGGHMLLVGVVGTAHQRTAENRPESDRLAEFAVALEDIPVVGAEHLTGGGVVVDRQERHYRDVGLLAFEPLVEECFRVVGLADLIRRNASVVVDVVGITTVVDIVVEVLTTVVVEVNERPVRIRLRVSRDGRPVGGVHDGDELPGDLAGADRRQVALGHPHTV